MQECFDIRKLFQGLCNGKKVEKYCPRVGNLFWFACPNWLNHTQFFLCVDQDCFLKFIAVILEASHAQGCPPLSMLEDYVGVVNKNTYYIKLNITSFLFPIYQQKVVFLSLYYNEL